MAITTTDTSKAVTTLEVADFILKDALYMYVKFQAIPRKCLRFCDKVLQGQRKKSIRLCTSTKYVLCVGW